MQDNYKKRSEPKIRHTIRDDFRQGNFGKNIKKEFSDLRDYFLDDDRRRRLTDMNVFKRWFFTGYWLLKALFLKLTPIRRLLLILALILSFSSVNVAGGDFSFGGDGELLPLLVILFILGLELKDKLMARDELEVGRKVQSSLMPERSPNVPGWDIWLYSKPAKEVGGDLVDFIALTDKEFAVVVADVSGKGLGAALFMAKLQAIIRSLAPDYKSLAKLVNKINEIFCRDIASNNFASMLIFKGLTEWGSVRILNAGHNPPYIIRQGDIKEMAKGSAALGIMPDTRFEEQHVDLKAGEILFIYSDGLTEARNDRDEFYGEERLRQLIRSLSQEEAKVIGEKIQADVAQFSEDVNLNDDLSIAVIKKK